MKTDLPRKRSNRLASSCSKGLVDWLLSCPEKGFFVPISSESTDSLRNGLTVVTRNQADFERAEVPVVNPFL
jgi:hypothetical protein